MTQVRILSSEDVRGLADTEEIIDAVREGYAERGRGAPANPRTTLPSPGEPGILTSYLAILPEMGYMGGYMYAGGFRAGDAWFSTPLFDAETGELLAIIDGAWMNPYKTGAVGAVAIDALARADATSLGIIGSGSQARGQLRAASTVRDLERVLVHSPTREHRETFASEFDSSLDAAVTAVDDVNALVRDVDILITATTASTPVFDGEALQPGTHITAMGQYHPEHREVDAETVARSTYVLDLRDRAHQDAGAFIHALEAGHVDEDHVHAELGEVIAGVRSGRTSDEEITLFDSGGTAIETVATAGLLYERALTEGRGTRVEFSPASEAFDA